MTAQDIIQGPVGRFSIPLLLLVPAVAMIFWLGGFHAELKAANEGIERLESQQFTDQEAQTLAAKWRADLSSEIAAIEAAQVVLGSELVQVNRDLNRVLQLLPYGADDFNTEGRQP
ncbi:MAG: hypothetical protein AAGI03_01805 [Pseudomonadota bacterium]